MEQQHLRYVRGNGIRNVTNNERRHNMETIGEKIGPILNGIEDALWDHEILIGEQPYFTNDGFRAAVKIFMSAMMDKMYTLQKSEDIELEDKAAMAESLGRQIRTLVKTYCNIDTHELYIE
jgi:hypothetical protein